MSFAVDRSTQIRERRALIKARFSLANAFAMCPVGAQDFFGDEIVDYCPCCRRGDMIIRGEVFRCGGCHAAGDAVTWVMMVRSVSSQRAMNLIEEWLLRAGCTKGRLHTS